jgi:hypothetical protein
VPSARFEGGAHVLDVVMVLTTLVVFALMAAFVVWLDWI